MLWHPYLFPQGRWRVSKILVLHVRNIGWWILRTKRFPSLKFTKEILDIRMTHKEFLLGKGLMMDIIHMTWRTRVPIQRVPMNTCLQVFVELWTLLKVCNGIMPTWERQDIKWLGNMRWRWLGWIIRVLSPRLSNPSLCSCFHWIMRFIIHSKTTKKNLKN